MAMIIQLLCVVAASAVVAHAPIGVHDYATHATVVSTDIVMDRLHGARDHESDGESVEIVEASISIPIGRRLIIGSGTFALTECTASQYESTPPSGSGDAQTDRECATITTECPQGQHETAAPTTTTDRLCATHDTCQSHEYELAAPTWNSDRVCAVAATCNDTGISELHSYNTDTACFNGHAIHQVSAPVIRRNEANNYTTTCSHVHCLTQDHYESGVLHHVIKVQHHNDEEYGHKHICKHGLHEHNMCGCECFDETFDFFNFDNFQSGHPQLTPAAASIRYHHHHGSDNRTIEVVTQIEDSAWTAKSNDATMGWVDNVHEGLGGLMTGDPAEVTYADLVHEIVPSKGMKLESLEFNFTYSLGHFDVNNDSPVTFEVEAIDMITGFATVIYESPQFNGYTNPQNETHCQTVFPDPYIVEEKGLRVDATNGLKIRFNFHNNARNLLLVILSEVVETVTAIGRYSKCDEESRTCKVCETYANGVFDPDCHFATEYCHAAEGNLCGECTSLEASASHEDGINACTDKYSRVFYPGAGAETASPTPAPTFNLPTENGEMGIVLTTIYDGKHASPKGVEVYIAKDGNYSDWSIGIASNGKTGGGWIQSHIFGVETVGFKHVSSTLYDLEAMGVAHDKIFDIDFDRNGNDAFAIYHCPDNEEDDCYRYDVFGDPWHPDYNTDYFGFNWVYQDSYATRKHGAHPQGTWDIAAWNVKGQNYLETCNCDQDAELLSAFGSWRPIP